MKSMTEKELLQLIKNEKWTHETNASFGDEYIDFDFTNDDEESDVAILEHIALCSKIKIVYEEYWHYPFSYDFDERELLKYNLNIFDLNNDEIKLIFTSNFIPTEYFSSYDNLKAKMPKVFTKTPISSLKNYLRQKTIETRKKWAKERF